MARLGSAQFLHILGWILLYKVMIWRPFFCVFFCAGIHIRAAEVFLANVCLRLLLVLAVFFRIFHSMLFSFFHQGLAAIFPCKAARIFRVRLENLALLLELFFLLLRV